MAYRDIGKIHKKVILNDLEGWGLFPSTEEGHHDAVKFMAGEKITSKSIISWEDNCIGFIASANKKTWGEIPFGATPMRMYFSVYLSDDIDSNIYYSAIVDEAELFDVVLSHDGEIIGNLYRQEMNWDSEEFAEQEDDDRNYALSIITEEGLIGRAYFGYSKDAPISEKIMSLYTSALAKLTLALGDQQEFQAAISDFETGQSMRTALEIILVNKKSDNELTDWYNPVEGLPKWKVLLPYVEDGINNALYQPLTETPIDVIESMLYKANGNKLPWLGKSMRFLTRPSLEDIRMKSYSPLLVSIEPIASRVSSLIEVEPTDETRTIFVDDLEVVIFHSVEKQPAKFRSKEIDIFSFRIIAIQEDIDLMLSFDYISHNQTDAYEKDVVSIIGNLVRSLQGVKV